MGDHGIIMTFIIGLIVGVIAKFLTPGRETFGFIVTAIIGIAGSFLATYVGQAIGWYQAGQAAGWITSILGAVVLLLIYHFVKNRSAS